MFVKRPTRPRANILTQTYNHFLTLDHFRQHHPTVDKRKNFNRPYSPPPPPTPSRNNNISRKYHLCLECEKLNVKSKYFVLLQKSSEQHSMVTWVVWGLLNTCMVILYWLYNVWNLKSQTSKYKYFDYLKSKHWAAHHGHLRSTKYTYLMLTWKHDIFYWIHYIIQWTPVICGHSRDREFVSSI